MAEQWFYGIKQLQFNYIDNYSDPTVTYKDKVLDYYELENTLYDMYMEENDCGLSFDNWLVMQEERVLDIADGMCSFLNL